MNKLIFLLLFTFPVYSYSLELYECKFSSKLPSSKGSFIHRGDGVVFVDGDKFIAHDTDNFKYTSPKLSNEQNNILIGQNDLYVYALSKDKTNYAVLLKNSELAYQWDQCVLYKKIDMKNGFLEGEPKNYISKIKEYTNAQLKDPYSAKYSNFSKPKKSFAVSNNKIIKGHFVCFDINAKNSFGGYVGKKKEWVFFQKNEIVSSSDRIGNFDEKWLNVSCDN